MSTLSDGIETKLQSMELSPRHSPGLTHRTAPPIQSYELDLTLNTAISHLINHLIQPINRLYPSQIISNLRLRLTHSLTELYAPTWNTKQPQSGSGFRSLICTKALGLPKVLLEAAKEAGVDESTWRKALSKSPEEDPEGKFKDEWEAWCDPGTVVWRYGGWEWEDPDFDPFKAVKGKYQMIWSSSSSPKPVPQTVPSIPTPARPSYAIPIRAPVPLPAVFAIPPTPANHSTTTVPQQPGSPLLPPASISRTPSPSPSNASSSSFSIISSMKIQSRSSSNPTSVFSHRGTDSTSSNGSSESDISAQQLLTPQTRPPSTDAFASDKSNKSVTPTQRGRTTSSPTPNTSVNTTTVGGTNNTPTVTPYDGGNVTVLGGGVKLGGISRPSSVMSVGRNHDRSRSPSISLASRALSSALGPNGQPTTRKTRTRRRIMPTYLGHLQPGLGGTTTPFGAFSPAIQPQPGWQGVGGVGVGVAPPPIPGMSRPLGQLRISSI